MAVFYASDHHFSGHSSRPFGIVEDMDTVMLERWNSVVRPDDDVYHLGDLTFGTTKHALELLPQLNGRLHMVLGNHDKWWTRATRTKQAELRDYVDILPPLGTYKFNGLYMVLCHYPLREWEFSYRGSVHLHGHTHKTYPRWYESTVGEPRPDSEKSPNVVAGIAINMCVEYWDYTPVSLITLTQYMAGILRGTTGGGGSKKLPTSGA